MLGSSCKKDKLVNEIDKLPPATQTGANTFGCLVNGKAWIAQNKDCSIICDDPFKIFYDAGMGGNLFIKAFRKDNQNKVDDFISLPFDSTNFNLLHNYQNRSHTIFSYRNNKNIGSCKEYISYDSTVITYGHVYLTKYDLQAGVVSGTFEIQLRKIGCEDINITNGRFDKKL